MSWWDDGDEADDEGEYSEYDESSVRTRPNPKANRPRTKQRPAYAEAVEGVVWTVDRGRYGVLLDAGTPDEREITTARARELGKKSVVTGDRVDVVGDTTGAEGSLARIVRVQDRTTLLRRSADDSDAVERVIVANADQMLIVVAAADPEPRPRLVDRYMVAAFDAGVEPILVITKTDLADPAAFAAHFSCLDLRILTSTSDAFTLDGGEESPALRDLREVLDGHVTVTVGHSGVGKSTLVNALTGSQRAVGVVNTVTGRGRHTSSSTVSFKVPSGGWIIDTPGVRSFGLGHVNPENILQSFASHAVFPDDYRPPGGIPLDQAHDWEIVDRVMAGELGDVGRERIESLQALLVSKG